MKKLDSRTFDDLLLEQDALKTGRFDLREIEMVTPGALVNLAAACYAIDERGKQPVILLNEDAPATSYLFRSGFLGVIDGVARTRPDMTGFASNNFEHLYGSSRLLIELTRIQTGRELPALLDQMVDVLCQDLEYDKYEAFDVTTAVSEVAQNTFDHNTDTSGFLAMQVYRARTGKRFLEIGVADYGIGLRRTLAKNPNNKPMHGDLEAIKLATQRGTSQYDDPTRGTGLYHLLRIAQQLAGSVQLRCGNGKVIYRYDNSRQYAFVVEHLPGVQITLQLSQKD